MKLSELRNVLAIEGIRPTKSLGQNFLHDANQIRRIVDAAELTKRDKVLEIGPGLGALTGRLLEQAEEVLAIEKDAKLAALLRKNFNADPDGSSLGSPGRARSKTALELLHDDALNFLKREDRDWTQWKVVANLPYSVASPILVELASGERPPERMVVTLQLEVAKRLVAQPGDEDYGLLTLLIQPSFETQSWFRIPAGCFFPPPDVDSACVCLRRRPQHLLPAGRRAIFVKIVKRGFSQRRKMMFKLLKQDWDAVALEAAYRRAGLQPQVRAEQVGLSEFIQLTDCLAPSDGGSR